MINKLTAIGGILLSTISYGQQAIHRCGTVEYTHYRESLQPGFQQSMQTVFEAAKASSFQKSETEYTIPVVVHVVYNNETQNIPDSVIFNQIAILNQDFNRENADTVNMRSAFQPYVGGANIRFKLATIDPNGNTTTGITRTATTTNSFMDLVGMMSNDFSAMEKVKSTANGGIDPWNQSRYLNIWVCNMAIVMGETETPMLMGYATPPNGLSNWPPNSTAGLSDGVVIQFNAFGSNNPNPLIVQNQTLSVKGRTVTHEVGHYLGLRHVWGDGDCSVDDGVADTPNADAASQQDCNATKNTCVDNIGGVDLPDMIENFMDYSAEDCQNSFSKQQLDIVRAVIENQRWDLVHNNVVGITEMEQINASISPNPSHSTITLQADATLNGLILIHDINGKEVMHFNAEGKTTVFSIAHLDQGIYHLSFENKGKRDHIKLVKI